MLPRLLSAALVSTVVSAQYHAFQWKFGNNFIDDTLAECQTLPIIVEPLSSTTGSTGVPPYYMLAFELGGVPTTTHIGAAPANLSWQNTHARGAQLMLSIVDSNTTIPNTGGQPPNLYTVTPGSDAACVSAADTAARAVVRANVTGTLATCAPWGLTISGGQKPYTVVLAALDSPITTNVTMGAADDVFTYADRADPNGQLMASVVDATGTWGVSSATVHTTGSNDTTCTGIVSSSKTTQQIQQEQSSAASAAARAQRQHRLRLGLGLGLGLGLPLLLLVAAALVRARRRRDRHARGIWDDTDAVARPWGHEMREVDAAAQTPEAKYGGDSPSATPFMRPPLYADATTSPSPSGSNTTTTNASANAGAQTAPKTRGRRRAERAVQIVDADADTQPDIIIQHRDGGAGAVVQELPPPYVDRTLPPSSSSTP